MPRWVKVFIAIGIVLAAALAVTAIAGVDHGPGLHTPSEDETEHVPPVDHGQ